MKFNQYQLRKTKTMLTETNSKPVFECCNITINLSKPPRTGKALTTRRSGIHSLFCSMIQQSNFIEI